MGKKYLVRFMNLNYKRRRKTYSGWKKNLKRRGDNFFGVEWMGYPDSFNSWDDHRALVTVYCSPRPIAR